MKLGLYACRFTYPGGPHEIAPILARIAQRAESAGFITHVMCGLVDMYEEGSLELIGSDIIPVVSKF